MSRRVLYKFPHGLGDTVMFSIVLKQLIAENPETFYTVETEKGQKEILEGYGARIVERLMPFYWREEVYDEIKNIHFLRPDERFAGLPTLKATNCLINEFPETYPDTKYYNYDLRIPKTPSQFQTSYGVLHFQGVSSKPQKDLTVMEAGYCIYLILQQQLQPVVIGELTPEITVLLETFEDLIHVKPDNAAHIYNLIANASLFFGIDSGPSHLACATDTPSIVFWCGNNPTTCMLATDNVTHLIPDLDYLPSEYDKEEFIKNYNYDLFGDNLENYLFETINSIEKENLTKDKKCLLHQKAETQNF